MTDSIASMDLGGRDRVGITSSLIYNTRPAAVLARKISYLGQANLQTYAPGSLVRLEIPTSPGTFLQTGTTQIKFNLNVGVTGGGAPAANQGHYFLDSSAASLVRRVRVYSGSSLIEDINEYSKIVELMSDAQKSNNECESVGFVEGYESGQLPPITGANYATPPTDVSQQHVGDDVNRALLDNANIRQTNLEWDSLRANVGQPVAANAAPYQFTIPLMSGTIGSMCPKWFPLGAAGAAPIRIELELNQNNAAVFQSVASRDAGAPNAGAVNWTIGQVEVHADIVQLDGNAMRLVEASVGGDFVVNTSSFRHSMGAVPTGATQSSTLLPFRFSSAKAILSRQYPQDAETSLVRRSQSCAIRSNAIEYHHMIGSSHVPSNSVQLGVSEQATDAAISGTGGAGAINRTWRQGAIDGVNELMKALHGKNILQVSNKINTTNWNNADSAVDINGNISAVVLNTRQYGGHAPKNTFTYAVNLESQGKASDLVECGTSLVSLQCFLNTTYSPATAQNNTLHSWCLHDLRLEFVGGVCIPRY